MKAMRISPETIAQTTIGTNRMRPKVMRFGIFKSCPGYIGGSTGQRPGPTDISRAVHESCNLTSPQYTGARALAHPAIPT
jgi:hypothetical protein